MNFTLPRLFRNPAISNFFPFPLGLRNSGVRLYLDSKVSEKVIKMAITLIIFNNRSHSLNGFEPGFLVQSTLKVLGASKAPSGRG